MVNFHLKDDALEYLCDLNEFRIFVYKEFFFQTRIIAN